MHSCPQTGLIVVVTVTVICWVGIYHLVKWVL